MMATIAVKRGDHMKTNLQRWQRSPSDRSQRQKMTSRRKTRAGHRTFMKTSPLRGRRSLKEQCREAYTLYMFKWKGTLRAQLEKIETLDFFLNQFFSWIATSKGGSANMSIEPMWSTNPNRPDHKSPGRIPYSFRTAMWVLLMYPFKP